MNLVLARACSNSCPYCFEVTERKGEKQDLISIENVNKFAEWASNSNLRYLSLLGGEPFLHPKLGDIINIFRRECPVMQLQIFTGGVFKWTLLDCISPNDVGLTFNVNEPSDYKNPRQFEKVFENIETAIRKGFFVILGFNVWREDFDVKFMPELAHHFGRNIFRWTVANPQWGYRSTVVKPENYNRLAERCFALLQEAAHLNIIADLDCPLPLCFFDESQLAWVSQYHPGTASRMGCCEPVLDITPELEVIRCFALSELTRVKLNDFHNDDEIWHWFLRNVDFQLLPQGCFSHCGSCQHFNNGRCNGGCLAWHKSIVDLEAQTGESKLTEIMQEAINLGKPALALEHYNKANHWSKTSIPKFAAAFAAFQLGNYEEAFHYAAFAQDLATNPDLKNQIGKLIQKIPKSKYKRSNIPPGDEKTIKFISNGG